MAQYIKDVWSWDRISHVMGPRCGL